MLTKIRNIALSAVKGLSTGFVKAHDYFSQSHVTRRWLLAISTIVAVGLAVYVNVVDQPLRGETLLVTLVGGTGVTYGATRYLQSKNEKSGKDPEDI